MGKALVGLKVEVQVQVILVDNPRRLLTLDAGPA
jgi:hypothetical protein